MQDDDSLLRSFVTIKPAAEKILSDGTDVDDNAPCFEIKLTLGKHLYGNKPNHLHIFNNATVLNRTTINYPEIIIKK